MSPKGDKRRNIIAVARLARQWDGRSAANFGLPRVVRLEICRGREALKTLLGGFCVAVIRKHFDDLPGAVASLQGAPVVGEE